MIEIYTGPCADLLDLVPTFDVMIVDPPYRAHVHKAATSQSAKGGTRLRDLGFAHLTPQLRRTIAGFVPLIRKWSLVYSDVESTNVWRHSCHAAKAALLGKRRCPENYIRSIPWVRWSMPQLSGDRPTTGHEMLTCYWGSQRGKKSWNGPGNLTALRHEEADAPPVDVLEHKALRGDDKHKCEKPLDQALDLVEWFSEPGDTVFDPTCGSGTIGVACAILGRNFVGCEIDPDWAARAELRCLEAAEGVFSKRDQQRIDRYRNNVEQRKAA